VKKNRMKLINIFFNEDDEYALVEVKVDEETVHSILDQLEKANLDKLFRISGNKLINLRFVKRIEVEDIDPTDLTDYDEAYEEEA
jgi:DNA-binding LytR/AlgR family response regulator